MINKKRNSGITLIALVITIIVLLILAGVTIATLTGDNGLLTKAGQAKNATDIGKEKEEIGLAMLKASSENKYGNVDKEEFQRVLGEGTTVEKFGKNFLVTSRSGKQYRVYANGNIELYEYELMQPTSVYGKLDNDGTLYLRATNPEGYRTYTNSTSITLEWNTVLPASKEAVLKVVIEEAIAPTTTSEFFNGFTNVTTIEQIKNLHTENATSMDVMFGNCKKLNNIDVSYFNTAKTKKISSMFSNCVSITELDVSWFDTSKVTGAMNWMFAGTKCKSLDLSNFDTSGVTAMQCMFGNMTEVESIDVTSFNTSNVTKMNEMFMNCEKLKILDVSNFNMGNVKTVNAMFWNCKKIKKLDISKFDTKNVTDFYGMFYGCNELIAIDVSRYDTGKAENMNCMFGGCNSLTKLDLSSFNTLNLTRFSQMLAGVTAAIKLGPNWNPNITAQSTGYAGSSWNI